MAGIADVSHSHETAVPCKHFNFEDSTSDQKNVLTQCIIYFPACGALVLYQFLSRINIQVCYVGNILMNLQCAPVTIQF